MKNNYVVSIFLVLLIGSLNHCYAGNKIALLIGIADYRDPKTVRSNGDLLGPVNDVQEMRNVLKARWRFDDIRVLTNQQASFNGITKALRQLQIDSGPGDQIFFYYSGHGTSSEDNHAPVPYGSGAQLAYDFPFTGTRKQQLAHLIIGQRDLQPVFKAIEKKGARLFVAIDSCYSGQAVRALNTGLINHKPFLSRNVPIAPDDSMSEDLYRYTRLPLPPYPYTKVFFIAAATDTQQASDINAASDHAPATRSGKSHGAFSDALLRALWGELPETSSGDQPTTHLQIYQAVKNYMAGKFNQTPSMLPDIEEDESQSPLAYQPVFGHNKAIPSRVRKPLTPVTLQLKNLPPEFQQRINALPLVRIVEQGAEYILTRQNQDYLFGLSTGKLIIRNSDPNIVIKRLKRESWFKDIKNKAESNNSLNLDFRMKQNFYGNILMQNETVSFRLRSDQSGYMILLDLMPNGDIITLYPVTNSELSIVNAGKMTALPSQGAPEIKVMPPFGSDYLLAFYFKEKPAFLKQLSQQKLIKPNGAIMQQLNQSLNKGNQFGFAFIQLSTVKRL